MISFDTVGARLRTLPVWRGVRLARDWRRCPSAASALCGFLLVGSTGAAAQADLNRPNVVVILADDLGWGDVGAMNPSSTLPTPNIDRIAAEGMRFTDAHSAASVCTPSRYALLTGAYMWRTSRLKSGVTWGYDPPTIAAERPTLATLLGSRGYLSGVVGKWHLGMDVSRTDNTYHYSDRIAHGPLARGFDEFFGISASLDMPPYTYVRNDFFTTVPTLIQPARAGTLATNRGPRAEDFEFDEVLDRTVAEAKAFLHRAAEAERPFFLYLALAAPHVPVVPPARLRGHTTLGPYGDFVAQIDEAVGEIEAVLDEMGVKANTIMIFSSDNGSFMKRIDDDREDHVLDTFQKSYRISRHQSNGDWRDKKASLYEGGHRVPLLVRWPGEVAAGSHSAATVVHIDLFATLAELVGGPQPSSSPRVLSIESDSVLVNGPFTVSITFSESVTGFTLDGIQVVGGSASNLMGTGAAYTLDVEPDSGSTAVTVRVLVESAVNGDGDGNAERGRNFIVDTRAPEALAAAVRGSALVLAWNEPLDSSAVPPATAFALTNGDDSWSASAVSVLGAEVHLTLSAAVAEDETGLALSYTRPTGAGEAALLDRAGNEAADLLGFGVTNETNQDDSDGSATDTTPPVLVARIAAIIDGAVLTLLWNEPLDPTSVPATDAFRLTGGSTPRTIVAVWVQGREVELVLSEPVARHESSFTLHYTAPATKPLRDLAGIGAESLSADVDNLTVDWTPPAHSVSMLPLLRGQGELRGAPVIHQNHQYKFALRHGPWKLVRLSPPKLFNLAVDPKESRNVAADHPALIRDLEQLFKEMKDATWDGTAARSNDATLSALNLVDVPLGQFDANTFSYAAGVAWGTGSTTVAATAANAGALVTIEPRDADRVATGHQVNLGVGGDNVITAWVTAEDGTTNTYSVTVTREANKAPLAVGSIDAQKLQVGDGTADVELSEAFEDPEDDTLTYAAWSSAAAVAEGSISGSRVIVTPVARGNAEITVTATDVAGSNTPAEQRFEVTVKGRRGVTLSAAALTVTEGARGTYTVELSSEPTGSVTVTPIVPAGTDVSVSPARLEFTTANWNIEKTVNVDAAPDADTDPDPSVTITHEVSGADYGSVTAPSVQVTIVEKDTSTLALDAAKAGEGEGTLVFEVTLSKSNTSEITVDYATSDGSGAGGARAGSDYAEARGTLTFPADSTLPRQIVVDVMDDEEDEEEEEILRLTLRNPRHASLAGGGSSLQVLGKIIDDDDPDVEASFGSASYSVTEGATVTVAVGLNRDPERRVEIELLRALHGGAEDVDYSGVPDRVTFGPGVVTQEFLVSATDDLANDDGEEVALSFGALPPGVSGSGETTLAIRDNDGGGNQGGGGGGPPPADDNDEDDEDEDGTGGGGAGGVGGGPPRAAISAAAECDGSLCRAVTGAPVRFEDASTGAVRFRRWDFGDGRERRDRIQRHVWSEPGFYEVSLWTSDGSEESTASLTFLVEAAAPAGTCVAGAHARCLRDSRFAVEVEWWTGAGQTGAGTAVHAGTNDSALFAFFDPDNWEILVKVLDGCSLNGHVWVFAASTTDLGYVIRVTDTAAGTVREYRNEAGLPAGAIADDTAFGACSR